jgi:hypothetical protein
LRIHYVHARETDEHLCTANVNTTDTLERLS